MTSNGEQAACVKGAGSEDSSKFVSHGAGYTSEDDATVDVFQEGAAGGMSQRGGDVCDEAIPDVRFRTEAFREAGELVGLESYGGTKKGVPGGFEMCLKSGRTDGVLRGREERGRKGQLGELEGGGDDGGAGAPFEVGLVGGALAANAGVLASETVLGDEMGVEDVAVGEWDCGDEVCEGDGSGDVTGQRRRRRCGCDGIGIVASPESGLNFGLGLGLAVVVGSPQRARCVLQR